MKKIIINTILSVLFFSYDINSNEKKLNLKPNIIVIMADDLGYADLSSYGASRIQTLNIDKLAREGLKFTSGYSTASACTRTRYSFLTGIYAFRKKYRNCTS